MPDDVWSNEANKVANLNVGFPEGIPNLCESRSRPGCVIQ